MPGTPGGSSYASLGVFSAFSGATGAVTAAQVLAEMTFPFAAGKIGGMEFFAVTAGTGGGNTVLDVLLNGTSIWTAAGDKPTLLAVTANGRFTQASPNVKALRYGDRITIIALTVSSTGHARVSGAVALEKA
jgi:hypothetical protein